MIRVDFGHEDNDTIHCVQNILLLNNHQIIQGKCVVALLNARLNPSILNPNSSLSLRHGTVAATDR